MSFFEMNLNYFVDKIPGLQAFLERADRAALKMMNSRKGPWTAEVNGVLVQSRYNPEKEVSHLSKRHSGSLHLHIGLGLGYALKADSRGNQTDFLVFEPDPTVLLAAFEVHPVSQWVQEKQACLFIDRTVFLEALKENAAMTGHVLTYVCPYHKKVWAETVTMTLTQIRDIKASLSFEKQTHINRSRQVLMSTLSSLSYALDARPFQTDSASSSLVGLCRGMPMVIVSPGPSLEKNLADLIPYRRKVRIMALARSVPVLKRFGIEPDFLVHIEFQDFISLIEHSTNLAETIFLLPYQCHFRYFQFPARAHYVYYSAYNLMLKWFQIQGVLPRQSPVPTGGSVAHDALGLALVMGASPVVLIGQDLALGPDQSNFSQNIKNDLKPLAGYFGGTVPSPGNYRQFHRWFEEFAETARVEYPAQMLLNCTEGGSFIEGFERRSLRDAAHLCFESRDELAFPIPLPEQGSILEGAGVEHVVKTLKKIREKVGRIQVLNRYVLTQIRERLSTYDHDRLTLPPELMEMDRQFSEAGKELFFYAAFFQEAIYEAREYEPSVKNPGTVLTRMKIIHSASLRSSSEVLKLLEKCMCMIRKL
jgi:hypothetical protein